MKKIKFFKLSLFSFVGLLMLASCTKDAALPNGPIFDESTVYYCVTSDDNMVLCSELEAYEQNLLDNPSQRVNYNYLRNNCTVYDFMNQPHPGTRCDPSHFGGCSDPHPCLPCKNC